MRFKTASNVNMTAYRGEVQTTFSELCEIFGKPKYGPNNYDMDKVTCEWALEAEDGTIITIYDWKTNRTPFQPYPWHIGGHTERAVDLVKDAITLHRDPFITLMRTYER